MVLLRSFRDFADAMFLLAALLLALISMALISSTFKDHLRNYKYPSCQVRSAIHLPRSACCLKDTRFCCPGFHSWHLGASMTSAPCIGPPTSLPS